MFGKQIERTPTEADKIIKHYGEEICDVGEKIMTLVKDIMSYQKAIDVLDGDTYLSDMCRVQRNKLYSLIEKRDMIIAKWNEMLEVGAYERVTTLGYKPYHCETREWIANQIKYLMCGK